MKKKKKNVCFLFSEKKKKKKKKNVCNFFFCMFHINIISANIALFLNRRVFLWSPYDTTSANSSSKFDRWPHISCTLWMRWIHVVSVQTR